MTLCSPGVPSVKYRVWKNSAAPNANWNTIAAKNAKRCTGDWSTRKRAANPSELPASRPYKISSSYLAPLSLRLHHPSIRLDFSNRTFSNSTFSNSTFDLGKNKSSSCWLTGAQNISAHY